jgi:RNA polymerase sigma factor (sigma-70 family)
MSPTTRATRAKPQNSAGPKSNNGQKLLARARKGERTAYLHLFMSQLPDLDRFIRHEIRYSETIGAVEIGLIDPCAIIDQVYIAALNTIKKMPAKTSFRAWLRYLALHILRQQVRIEHKEEPLGPHIEHSLEQDGAVDTDLWEFYQPDDVSNVEDVLVDPSASDPEAVLELRESEDEIEKTISQLPSELSDLLRLRLIEGLSIDKIAALQNKPPAAIRLGMQEACEALRKLTGDMLQA